MSWTAKPCDSSCAVVNQQCNKCLFTSEIFNKNILVILSLHHLLVFIKRSWLSVFLLYNQECLLNILGCSKGHFAVYREKQRNRFVILHIILEPAFISRLAKSSGGRIWLIIQWVKPQFPAQRTSSSTSLLNLGFKYIVEIIFPF
ncbi:hypothetical protein HAX54_004409 [Datura stramonium]|uniref:Uncharacterized protein n=1 Tax=Datura stramonium TaxID=4076 RepID=A0ABS8T6V7_DATST|nr:hypothetical protein [Datura stramonium]